MSDIRCSNQEEFEDFQAVQALSDLQALASACQRRFLAAAALVQLSGPAIKRLRRLGWNEVFDVHGLLPAWRILCHRYVDELYSPQLPLPLPTDDPLLQDPLNAPVVTWQRFVHHQLIPALVESNEVVRNVLFAVGGLPCRDRKTAVEALKLQLREMTLPGQSPTWIDTETREWL